MHYLSIDKEEWDHTLEKLLLSHNVFAPVNNDYSQDYELITAESIPEITYNKPKPATPLKAFFLPVRENVTVSRASDKPRIIIGIPNCDIQALGLLDEIYLDTDFDDLFYRSRRENTILIASDCFGIQEHCHCTSYGIKPFSSEKADLAVAQMNGQIIIRVLSGPGDRFINTFPHLVPVTDKNIITAIEREHKATEKLLKDKNKGLPDYFETGLLVNDAGKKIWEKYSLKCVSCGACTAICPTCTCFLLIDKPGFEKIKQMDACQYPGFQLVAGGEDPLSELPSRFRNRYLCKYVWKPARFSSIACTGCGRCIEACIGKINKNELFMELV